MDLTKILKDCPAGTKLYSTIFGDVKFSHIVKDSDCPIILHTYKGGVTVVTKHGRHNIDYENEGECVLFPSKEQRDWSKFERFWDKPKVKKFDPKTLQPFDKVLGFYEVEGGSWECNIFSHLIGKECSAVCTGMIYNKYIPYNEDTKHLIGTNDDCPEYYKWWKK